MNGSATTSPGCELWPMSTSETPCADSRSFGHDHPTFRHRAFPAPSPVALNPWDGIGEQPLDLPASLSPLSGSEQAYRTVIAGRDLVFVPYFKIDTERYNTYFRIA
jgi:hypothetical protein